MINCRVTVNFLREQSRLCKNHGGKDCSSVCPLYFERNGKGCDCTTLFDMFPECAIDIVQKWSDEHPIKTRLDDVKEKYPNIPVMNDGQPEIYPCALGYCSECRECRNFTNRVCWNEPLDGGATGKAVE